LKKRASMVGDGGRRNGRWSGGKESGVECLLE
jgi:hypothetical protein